MKLVVHDAYIDYITTGVMPDPTPAEEDWCKPRLECTDWYDMLDTKRRVRAFKVIWNVMEYMHREEDAPKTDLPFTGASQTVAPRSDAPKTDAPDTATEAT